MQNKNSGDKVMNIKIMVAAHKKYKMPQDTDLYVPVHVGKELHQDINLAGYVGDNSGDNISSKNGYYSELTAIYWAWKNLDADAVGLDHYRRYLSLKKTKSIDTVLTKKQIETIFESTDIILPKKRKYYIQNNYDHYIHAHHKEPLDVSREIIKERYPDYMNSFDYVMKQTSAHMFNMFIMKKDKFDEYCKWMFDVLFELEARIDITSYTTYEQRVYGFVSELLLDVWLKKNNYSYTEVNFVHMESQHWIKKGGSFLLRIISPKTR